MHNPPKQNTINQTKTINSKSTKAKAKPNNKINFKPSAQRIPKSTHQAHQTSKTYQPPKPNKPNENNPANTTNHHVRPKKHTFKTKQANINLKTTTINTTKSLKQFYTKSNTSKQSTKSQNSHTQNKTTKH